MKRIFIFIATLLSIPAALSDEPAVPRNHPKESWVNAGFASPDSALQTWLWAYSRGNKEVMLQALIPEAQKDWEKILGGKTADQMRAEASQAFEKTQAYSIVKREVRSDEEIVLHLTRNGNTKVEKMVFKRIGKDWRLAGRDEPNGHKPKVTP